MNHPWGNRYRGISRDGMRM